MGILFIIARFWMISIFFLAILIIAFADTQHKIRIRRHRAIVANREEFYTEIQ